MWRYCGLVWRRAAAETNKNLSLTWGTFYRTVLVSAAGVAIAWLVVNRENAVTMAGAVLISVILANVVVYLVLLLINLVRVPALIHAEQQRAISRAERDLAQALDDKQPARERSELVGTLRRSGLALFNRKVRDEPDLERWRNDVKVWTDTAIAALETVLSNAEVDRFAEPGSLKAWRFLNSFNPEHNSWLLSLDYRIKFLEGLTPPPR